MAKSTSTVMLDREVIRAAKVCAAEEGITLKAYVERAMLAYVQRWPRPKRSRRGVSSSPLPGP